MGRFLLSMWVVVGGLQACGESHDRPTDAAVRDGNVPDTGSAADAGPDAAIDVGPCEHATDCRLLPATCCGSCGAYTHDDIISLPADDADEYIDRVCADVGGCPACVEEPDPALLAVCEDGACGVVDITPPETGAVSPYNECETSEDCVLRVATCCECGTTITYGNTLAVHRDRLADLEALLCAPDASCDDCVGEYPEYLFTHCGADTADGPKRCVVDLVGP